MLIAVIGAGNLGGNLAKSFAKAGHRVFLGVRNTDDPKIQTLLSANITAHAVTDAARQAEVIVVTVNPQAAEEIAKQLGDVSKKIIIDAMNSFYAKPHGFETTAEAFLSWTNCQDVVKCFNTIGAEHIHNPEFNGNHADMFVAGDSQKGKAVATQLATDIGFGKVYDLGGNDIFAGIEQLAKVWIAIAGTYGRDIGFKILTK